MNQHHRLADVRVLVVDDDPDILEVMEIAFKMLEAEGWEPLDCGGPEDIPKIETGFHPRRVRHPRHLEFNGPKHP